MALRSQPTPSSPAARTAAKVAAKVALTCTARTMYVGSASFVHHSPVGPPAAVPLQPAATTHACHGAYLTINGSSQPCMMMVVAVSGGPSRASTRVGGLALWLSMFVIVRRTRRPLAALDRVFGRRLACVEQDCWTCRSSSRQATRGTAKDCLGGRKGNRHEHQCHQMMPQSPVR